MSAPVLKIALQTLGHTRALKDASVRVPGVALEFVQVPSIVQAFRRMVRDLEFDVSEMAFTTYLCAREHGKPFTALPVFLVRGLHHGTILCDTRQAIRAPRDLEDQKVGVNRGYTVTTGVWARGILQHEFGVDLDRVTWVRSGDEHVAEYTPPANVVSLGAGKTLESALVGGELAATIGVSVTHPLIAPLIHDAQEHAYRVLASDGFYPINHLVVVRDELLASRAQLASELMNAFSQAKQMYVERLCTQQSNDGWSSESSPADRLYRRVWQITGADPLPYGVEPNLLMIETLVRYAHEQRIIARAPAVRELFAPGTVEWRA